MNNGWVRLGLLIAVLVAAEAMRVHAQGNIVQNGSFEIGSRLPPEGWNGNAGRAFGFPGAADGRNWADVGILYQDLATSAGQLYHLRFAIAGNFNISDLAVLNVLWEGSQIGSVSWNPTGHTIENLGWVWADFDLAAHGTTTRLTFENPFAYPRIVRLDAVQVVAVPEPSARVLFFVAMVGLSTRVNGRSSRLGRT